MRTIFSNLPRGKTLHLNGLLTICKPYCGSWFAPPRPFVVFTSGLVRSWYRPMEFAPVRLSTSGEAGYKRIAAAALPASTELAVVPGDLSTDIRTCFCE